MTREDLFDAIVDVICDMDDYEQISIWNEYCDDNSCYDERIYYYEELNDLCYNMNPLDIIEAYGEIAGCSYFKETIWGAEACDCDDFDMDDLVEYIIDNEKSYGYSEIEDLIDEWLESEEEEEEE